MMASFKVAPVTPVVRPARLRAAVCRAATGSESKAKVVLKIQKHCQYGQSVAIVGSGQELGSWKPEKAVKLQWTEGDVWMTSEPLDLSTGSTYEYKYIVCFKREPQRFDWMQGSNMKLAIPSAASTIEVMDAWGAGQKTLRALGADGSVVETSAPAAAVPAPAAEAPAAVAAVADAAVTPSEAKYPEEALQTPGSPLATEAEVIEDGAVTEVIEAAKKEAASVEEPEDSSDDSGSASNIVPMPAAPVAASPAEKKKKGGNKSPAAEKGSGDNKPFGKLFSFMKRD